jgi:thiamine-phosphate diphosphorylase
VDTGSPAVSSTVPVLHAVTNDEIVARPTFLDRARTVMRAMGSRGVLQLRASRLAQDQSARFVELALTLAEEQERTGSWLVINDRVDIALIVCAHAVQLTRNSLDVSDAVLVLAKSHAQCPTPLTCAIGASVHSLEEAIAARLAGALWGVVGDVRGSQSTANGKNESGPALLERIVRYGGIPIVAIGGILPQHVAAMRRAGVHGIAAIRGIWDADHSEHAVLDYLSAYDSEVGR